MVSAIGLGIIGIGITLFLGLGGVDFAKAQVSSAKSSLPKFGNSQLIDNLPTQRKIIQTQPNEKPMIIRTPAPSVITSNSTNTVSRRGKNEKAFTKQELQDIQNLNQRRARANKAKQPFKKSGEEIVRIKRAEAQRASKNKVFQGTNNFANPNFDLGLPNTATQADRDRVIRDRTQRNAKRDSSAQRKSQNASRLASAQSFNLKVKEIKSRNLSKKGERILLDALKVKLS